MKNRFLLSGILLLAMLWVSCDMEDDVGSTEPENPVIEETIDTLIASSGVAFVRTPDTYFENLPDWPYNYQYVEIDGLRQAYAEDGPASGPVVLLLHGQPSWSYLYRKMMPVLADAGYRVIAMDHIGMGRSDKPIDINYYSYLGHAERLEQFIQALGLTDINLFVQDWGSLIGLRVAGLNPEWFATISVGNGDLPVIPAGVEPFPPVENPDEHEDIGFAPSALPDQQFPFYDGCELLFGGGGQQEGFGTWINYAMKDTTFRPSVVLESNTWFPLSAVEEAAYDAPFPSREYMAGVRTFPSLINQMPGLNEDAWAGLTSFEKPFLTVWGGNDPGTLGSCETQQKFIDEVPGAEEKPHARLAEASHFLQSDQGEEIARRMIDFYNGDYDGGNFGNTAETCPFDPSEDLRRYCEFLLLYQDGSELFAEVWGTQGLSNCPSQCLEEVDLEAIKAEYGALDISLNGPRIWLPDGEGNPPAVDPRIFGTLEVKLLATIPVDLSNPPAGGSEMGDPYVEVIVNRNTIYQYPSGSEVYELTSPDGAIYTMQSVSLIIDPDLTVADLPTLSSRLQLPDGWTYQARTLSEDLVLTVNGEAVICTDDLGNTYQKRTF